MRASLRFESFFARLYVFESSDYLPASLNKTLHLSKIFLNAYDSSSLRHNFASKRFFLT